MGSPNRDSDRQDSTRAGSQAAADNTRHPITKHPTQLHGSLIEVCDLGVLILGPSGVGKSECVIELVRRGQRMVADDVVQLWTSGDGRLFGRAPEAIRHHIEIRGLGLLSVADLYGPESVLDECAIGMVCRLESHRARGDYERIGIERPRETFLGVSLPTVRLPVHAAASLATLVELAARDWNLRLSGVNAAKRLDERLRGRGAILDGADNVSEKSDLSQKLEVEDASKKHDVVGASGGRKR